MADKNLFQTLRGALLPRAETRNDAGGVAYELPPEAALAQLAATGCLSGTYYASAETQLDRVLGLAGAVSPEFVAKVALYSRRRGAMKDMPALLCAVLAVRDLELLAAVFPRVIDNGRMLRNFVQIVRSGVTGRKSFGSAPKRLVRQWLEAADERQLVNASIGKSPSLGDIVRMVHPRPNSAWREAFYGWLIGKPYDPEALPVRLREFEAWKATATGVPGDADVPDVPFQMLTALGLGRDGWTLVARRASWQTTRMNLNTFARHGVFQDPAMVEVVAERLASPELVRRSRAFPYQLLAAYRHAGKGVPAPVRDALHDAMEAATANVPSTGGAVAVCADVSGSMHCPVTGYRRGASSALRCVDVAALVAAALARKNPGTVVLPFDWDVVDVAVNGRDSVMTNAERLAKVGGGGTNCSAPLKRLNRRRLAPDLVVFVSDNESWVDSRPGTRHTAVMAEWQKLRSRNPDAKLVCIDLVPNTTAQAPAGRDDILHIGGFSDAVFDVLAKFAGGEGGAGHWVREIEAEDLGPAFAKAG